MNDLIRPRTDEPVRIEVSPATAGWEMLDFKVVGLGPGERWTGRETDTERALVPQEGAAAIIAGGARYEVSRSSVFTEMPHVLYVGPGTDVTVEAVDSFTFTIGGAPATGRYPTRLFEPNEMKSEIRGGGAATRQVNHILAHPLPAERLILYEVYVPRGSWSGWPPHCHDGYAGSPYLEETYYFRLDPADGFAVHRNWREDSDFDEVLPAGDGDLVLVPQGFHTTAAAPGANLYFLNYLAGELENEARGTPPYFHPDYTWIEADWERGAMHLPAVRPDRHPPGR